MNPRHRAGVSLLGLGIVGSLFLYVVIGMENLFAITGDIDAVHIPPILITLATVFCLLTGVGALTGTLPVQWD
jgi:hypothetical protein